MAQSPDRQSWRESTGGMNAGNQNSLEAMEESMVLIQKSLDTIKETASDFDELQGNNKAVLAAMTQLTNKVASLEAKLETSGFQMKRKGKVVDVPLYIKVSLVMKAS